MLCICVSLGEQFLGDYCEENTNKLRGNRRLYLLRATSNTKIELRVDMIKLLCDRTTRFDLTPNHHHIL